MLKQLILSPTCRQGKATRQNGPGSMTLEHHASPGRPCGLERKKESEVTQLCPTLCDPVDCSLSGSSIHGIFQARLLEWIAISFSRGSSQPRDQTQVSHIVGRCFTVWATKTICQNYISDCHLPAWKPVPIPRQSLHQFFLLLCFVFNYKIYSRGKKFYLD